MPQNGGGPRPKALEAVRHIVGGPGVSKVEEAHHEGGVANVPYADSLPPSSHAEGGGGAGSGGFGGQPWGGGGGSWTPTYMA